MLEPDASRRAYDLAVRDLEDLARQPIDATPPLSAERMRRLLALRGQPQRAMRVVVVAGTVGKGSSSTMLASILRAAGLRTGLFTGPHLVHYTERIQVDGVEMGMGEWARRVVEVLQLARAVADEGDPRRRPSLLEVLALVALEAFRDAGVGCAIMEAGVGGFRDYTGGLEACACLLTEIDFDHTHLLGDTIEEIASDKAGIVRAGVPLVATCSRSDAVRVVEERCRALGAPLRLLGRDFRGDATRTDAQGTWLDFTCPARGVEWHGLHVRLPGRHQAANAAGAIATALEVLAPPPAAAASAGPASAGPASAGPASAGSASAGPASAGPASAGPASAGSASAGSASAGSASEGSASEGSASAGSASAGPASAGASGAGPASAGSAGAGSAYAAAVREGLAEARFPGRLELHPLDPPVLLDGAHQPAGTRALRAALADLFPGRPVHLVVGILSDKDREGMAAVLAPVASRITVTAPPWASRAGDLAPVRDAMQRHAAPGVGVTVQPDCRRALDEARAAARERGALVCVSGSLYLVGAVREILEAEGRP